MDFYDAVTPGNIPQGAHACLYYDGEFAATAGQAKRFAAVRWITVLGGAAAAAHTGILDWEKGNADFTGTELRDWAAQRKAMNCKARVYVDRANFAAASKDVEGLDNVWWWIATLDGDKLSATWTGRLWAVQYAGGMTAKVDTSVLYGAW